MINFGDVLVKVETYVTFLFPKSISLHIGDIGIFPTLQDSIELEFSTRSFDILKLRETSASWLPDRPVERSATKVQLSKTSEEQ